MKTTMKILTSGLMVLALVIASCSKDSVAGDIGPIGPRGEQGLQGDKGEPGEAQGIAGKKVTKESQAQKGMLELQGQPGILAQKEIQVRPALQGKMATRMRPNTNSKAMIFLPVNIGRFMSLFQS